MKALIKAAIILLLGAVSCSKEYVEEYSTIYRTDKDGNKVCRLFTEYNVNAATASHAMVIYYSGDWTVEFTEDVDWVAIPFSRRSSQPRDQTWVSCIATNICPHAEVASVFH